MTTPSANPRRFSRGPNGLDPAEPISLFVSLALITADIDKVYKSLQRYRADFPQARVRVVGLTHEEHGDRLIIEVQLGGIRDALRGESPEMLAGWAFLYRITKAMYYARPALTSPPSALEREQFAALTEGVSVLRSAV